MENLKQSTILFKEIGTLTKKTMDYNKKIKEAKTQTKVNYYRKKMIRNNKKIEILLPVADRLEKQELNAVEQKVTEEVA